jgi:hypothetical protein
VREVRGGALVREALRQYVVSGFSRT